jgi:hypothetical protein
MITDYKMELAKAIKEGTLDLICPKMKLLRCPGYHEVALEGTGAIRSDNLGRLYFRLVAPFKGVVHEALQPSKPPGELLAPNDYVMLSATDEYGREWRSDPMIVNLDNQIPLPNWRVRKSISRLAYTKTVEKSDHSSVEILVPNSPLLPLDTVTQTVKKVDERETAWTRSFDHHTHHIGDAEVMFRSEDDNWLSVRASCRNAFMPTWAGLLCQSIGFVTAQTIRPVIITRSFHEREDIGLFSGPFLRLESRMPGPVRVSGLDKAGHFWRLLELFFNYLEQRGLEASTLIEEIEGVRRGSQGSFQTSCLTLAVGIESIAKLLLKDARPPKLGSDVIQSLVDHMKTWAGDCNVKKRAQKALERLTETSAADFLYAWAKRTDTPDSLVDGWKNLRNPRAHGKAIDAEQAGHDLYYGSVELMYRVIASALGYDGPILPTSQRGWGEGDSTEDM